MKIHPSCRVLILSQDPHHSVLICRFCQLFANLPYQGTPRNLHCSAAVNPGDGFAPIGGMPAAAGRNTFYISTVWHLASKSPNLKIAHVIHKFTHPCLTDGVWICILQQHKISYTPILPTSRQGESKRHQSAGDIRLSGHDNDVSIGITALPTRNNSIAFILEKKLHCSTSLRLSLTEPLAVPRFRRSLALLWTSRCEATGPRICAEPPGSYKMDMEKKDHHAMPCDVAIVHKFTWNCSGYLIISGMGKSWHGAGAIRAVAKRSHFFTPRSQPSGPLQASIQLTLELVDNTSLFSAQGAENISNVALNTLTYLGTCIPKVHLPRESWKTISVGSVSAEWVVWLQCVLICSEGPSGLRTILICIQLQEFIYLLCLVKLLYVVQSSVQVSRSCCPKTAWPRYATNSP